MKIPKYYWFNCKPVQEEPDGSTKQLLIAVISTGVMQSELSHLPSKTAGRADGPL